MWVLGLVSLLTDVATEAVYPFFPLFLVGLGASELAIGIIEGAADAVASLAKVGAGHVSDRWRRRQPLVLAGYSLSSIVRPLLALIASPWQGALIRCVDRFGKGVRGAPRDVLLAHYAPAGERGRVFGFHRAMDHLGAAIGPVLAAGYLLARPDQFRELFVLTAIPGLAVVWLVTRVTDPPPPAAVEARPATGSVAGLSPAFWRLMLVLFVFALGNASDAFLILALSAAGFSGGQIALLWAAHHVVKSLSSLFGGALSDRIGRRRSIGIGWAVYAVIYAGFAATTAPVTLVALFLGYGIYHGLTEGAEKALVADWVSPELRGTAFGIYGTALGIGAFAASVVFGAIWMVVSPAAAFLTGAALALVATAGLAVVRPSSS